MREINFEIEANSNIPMAKLRIPKGSNKVLRILSQYALIS